jgi:hypothetical protein
MVAGHSSNGLKVVSGVARLKGGRPLAVFYPVGHLTLNAYASTAHLPAPPPVTGRGHIFVTTSGVNLFPEFHENRRQIGPNGSYHIATASGKSAAEQCVTGFRSGTKSDVTSKSNNFIQTLNTGSSLPELLTGRGWKPSRHITWRGVFLRFGPNINLLRFSVRNRAKNHSNRNGIHGPLCMKSST